MTLFQQALYAIKAPIAYPSFDHQVSVLSYDDESDSFMIRNAAQWGGAGGGDEEMVRVPASLLPVIIREYGEPSELVGRVFNIKIS